MMIWAYAVARVWQKITTTNHLDELKEDFVRTAPLYAKKRGINPNLVYNYEIARALLHAKDETTEPNVLESIWESRVATSPK